jgi:hypothetical protein
MNLALLEVVLKDKRSTNKNHKKTADQPFNLKTALKFHTLSPRYPS